ncbi:MAG: DNA repair protein RecO [Spirochaetes bacterium GWF1_51_8]|nr:MAG: DNA repair protein RecO [Spirochaetes bacterium GWF1_51_8]
MNPRNSETNEEFHSSRLIRFQGIILKTDPFGDGNRILTLIDENHGKIRLSVFGSSRQNSRRKSAVLAGNLVNGIAVRPKIPQENQLPSVREISLCDSFDGIRGELKRLAYLYLVFEILDTALSGDSPFALYPLLPELMKRLAADTRFEKYAFYFIVTALIAEGIFPYYSGNFTGELSELTSEKHRLGNGTLRFIYDCENADGMSFWDGREISVSVRNELIDLFGRIFRSHYRRELKSLTLLSQSGNPRSS